MTIVRDTDINITTNMDICWSNRRIKYHIEQKIVFPRIPKDRPFSQLKATGRWITLEQISIEQATIYKTVDRFLFLVWMKYFKARQFPGSPMTKQTRNPVAVRQSYTLNSVGKLELKSGVDTGTFSNISMTALKVH